jgi:hypothetical protein
MYVPIKERERPRERERWRPRERERGRERARAHAVRGVGLRVYGGIGRHARACVCCMHVLACVT